jgi:hypothetical protein
VAWALPGAARSLEPGAGMLVTRAWKFLCGLRGHRVNDAEWGYGFGNLDLFCRRCGKRFASIPIGRLPIPWLPPEEPC